MIERMILAGFGGQGIMFMGKLLAYAGMLRGREVTWIPSYGPEMRGGTANCTVVISDQTITSPVVEKPTIVVAMNRPSLDKFMPMLEPGGRLFINSSIIKNVPLREDVEVLNVPANDIAHELGTANIANMVILGAMLTKMDIISKDDLFAALAENVPSERAQLLALNQQAIEKGIEFARG